MQPPETYINGLSLKYLPQIRKHFEGLPQVEEYVCHLTPAWRIKKKLLARLKEDGENLAIYTGDRDVWIEKDPQAFYVTEHYQNYSYVLARLDKVMPQDLKEILVQGWQERAPRKLVQSYSSEQP